MLIQELEQYGISQTVITKLNQLGYNELTSVQEQATKKGLFEGNSLVISAPTNTGKTFIAELATLDASSKREKRRTFYLVPLKALAEEKFLDCQRKYSDWGLRIAISTGDNSQFDNDLLSFDLVIATYEKLQTLIVRQPSITSDIGVVIIDELQNIGDLSRGVNLEILLTSLLISGEDIQIIGLSATIPNAKQISDWLNAELVETDKRDIDLHEGILYIGDRTLVFNNQNLTKGSFIYKEFNSGTIGVLHDFNLNEFDNLLSLAKQEQILIFSRTRSKARSLAGRLSRHLNYQGDINELLTQMDVLIEPTPTSLALRRSMDGGVAFHHAGLLKEERVIVEQAFEEGKIRIICSTPTLGAGVNTPAKTVVLQSYSLWDNSDITVRNYKNMVGRAGRLRYHDDNGRSVVIANSEKELEYLWNRYINAYPENVESILLKVLDVGLPILIILSCTEISNISELINFFRRSFFGFIHYLTSEEPVIKRYARAYLKLEFETRSIS